VASSVSGSFTITFDPTLTYTDQSITTSSLTGISSATPFVFDYSPTSYSVCGATFNAGELVAGGSNDGACAVAIDPSTLQNDFYLQILTFTTSPTFVQLGYTTASPDAYFYTLNGSTTTGDAITVTPETMGGGGGGTGVPEPSSLMLLSVGLFALGAAAWRKRACGARA